MDEVARQALVEYGRTILREGWRAGEPLIAENARRIQDFDKWARALGIMLRAQELQRARGEAS